MVNYDRIVDVDIDYYFDIRTMIKRFLYKNRK